MGAALAATLLSRGVTVTVWNRTESRAAPLIDLGAVWSRTGGEAIAVSPLTISMLGSSTDLRAVLDSHAAALPGRTVVDLSTGTPEDALGDVAALEVHGVTVLNGAVLGGPRDFGTPTLQILLAGPLRAWRAHETVIAVLGATCIYFGEDVAAPPAVHLAMSCSFQTLTLCAFVESLAYAKAFDVDRTEMVTIAGRLLERVKRQVADMAAATDAGDYSNPQATLDVYARSAELVRRSMLAAGLPARLIASSLEGMNEALAAGRGSDGLAVQFEFLRSGRDGS